MLQGSFIWWERRRANETTADYLGRVLDEVGLSAMATNARRAHYDDYFAPAEIDAGDNMSRLVRDLGEAMRAVHLRALREQIRSIRRAVINGEFDGTRQESQRWMAGKEGQDTLHDLLGGK